MNLQSEIPRYTLLVLVVLLLSTSCGFRGPLYLPEDSPPEAGAEQSASSQEAESADEDSESEEQRT